MDIFFNELSTQIMAENHEHANEWMSSFFQTADVFSKRIHKFVYIRTTMQIKSVLICNNYCFIEWLHTLKDKDFLRRIINRLTHKPLAEKYPYFYYNGTECQGLGAAFQENTFSISYPKTSWNNIVEITKEVFDENQNVIRENQQVKNISSIEHVYHYFPLRIFEHHKKHDNKRPRLDDGESTLHYSIPADQDKVQKLLDCAFGENRLYNWDGIVGMYIEFNFHEKNKLHGYHIQDGNRVPDSIKKKIKKFQTEK